MIKWLNKIIDWIVPFNSILCLIIFLALCFAPPIPLNSQLYIRAEDILLPLAFIGILSNIKLFKYWYYTFLLFWSLYCIVTMAINQRLTAYNDYTEIYKLFKFAVYSVLFYMYFLQNKNHFKPVAIAFSALFLINIFHYYSLFNINNSFLTYYSTNIYQLQFFDKNSLGLPCTKRIIGTMGNPNINAILFSIFSIYFMPFLVKNKNIIGKIFFYLSISMVLMTQSRTCFAAIFVIFIIFFVSKKPNYKSTAYIILGFIVTVLIVKFMDQYSLNYFTDTKFNVKQNGSLEGRLEAWHYLDQMILNKPIFGHGINKNFFYQNSIYSENEYILILWRYGIIGFVFYLVFIFGLLFYFLKKVFKFDNDIIIQYTQIVALYSINAFTNNPTSDPVLLVFFAIATGAFLSQCKINEKNKKSLC